MNPVERSLAALGIPEQYSLIFSGQWETIQETNSEMTTVILLAIFLVFVVLRYSTRSSAIHWSSWRRRPWRSSASYYCCG